MHKEVAFFIRVNSFSDVELMNVNYSLVAFRIYWWLNFIHVYHTSHLVLNGKICFCHVLITLLYCVYTPVSYCLICFFIAGLFDAIVWLWLCGYCIDLFINVG